MKKRITRLLILTFFCVVGLSTAYAQEPVIVSGTVTDAETKEPLIGVNIIVKGTVQGTVTDVSGKFSLKITRALPVTLGVSIIGYQSKDIEITSADGSMNIALEAQVMLGQEVVVSASRVEESVLQSPVSVEKMDIRAIRETPQASFYDALQNMKGIDMNTQSLTFRSVNMRGFNANGNTRTVQLIDGMDNQAPGLNFPVGNIVGMSELDLESVEVLPGASSALYGPNAINGIILMNSKNPFQYQGLSANVRTGIMNEKSRSKPSTGFIDASFRFAKSFNDKVAFKLNASYLQADDWQASDTRDQSLENGSTLTTGTRENNVGYDGVNVYGESGTNLRAGLRGNLTANVAANPLVGISRLTGVPVNTLFEQLIPNAYVSRIGYNERDLANYTTRSLKLNAALHARLSDKVELIVQGNYGNGTSVYTGADRYSLSNFYLYQAKVELKGSNFFVRGYTTGENSGDSYANNTLAAGINEGWKPSATAWFPQYFGTYASAAIGTFVTTLQTALAQGQSGTQAYQAALNAVNGGVQGFHNASRAFADQGRVLPGTSEFDRIASDVKSRAIPGDLTTPGRVGAKFLDRTALYHFEGMYNFTNQIKWAEIIVGANYRVYTLNSGGTLFATDNGKEYNINEFGFYGQIAKKLGEFVKVTASTRYDKNQNFQGQITPRLSVVATAAKTHNFRASIQTGFRIPTTQNQYIDLNVGSARLIGGLPLFIDRYKLNEADVFTLASIQRGAPVRFQPKEFKPERVISYEIGYKGLINNRLLIDAYYYRNTYKNFDAGITVVKSPGTLNQSVFSMPYNSDDDVNAQGAALGIDYSFGKGWGAGVNTAYNELLNEAKLKDAGLTPAFNTPKWRYNITFGNRNVVKNLGFGLTYRWQDAFVWQSSFVNANTNVAQLSAIPAYATLDAQVTYKIPNIKTLVKVGGTNILNKSYTTAWGNPTVGAMYYISLTFDQFMN